MHLSTQHNYTKRLHNQCSRKFQCLASELYTYGFLLQPIKAKQELKVWYSQQYEDRLRAMKLTECLRDPSESRDIHVL